VLIVKQAPRARYERLLIAADGTTAESEKLARYASSFEGESELELFHCFATLSNAGLRSNAGIVEVMTALRHAALPVTQGQSLRFSDSYATTQSVSIRQFGQTKCARHQGHCAEQ